MATKKDEKAKPRAARGAENKGRAKKAAVKKSKGSPAAGRRAVRAEKITPARASAQTTPDRGAESRVKKAAVRRVGPKSDAVEKRALPKTEERAQEMKKGSYIPAIGRRKTSVARVRLIKNGRGEITINGRALDRYFGVAEHRRQVLDPLVIAGQADAVDVSVKVLGGGMRGQAEAVRQGISRALVRLNPTFRKSLKKHGFLSRDARAKERKKPGLKKARRAPQWSKR
jgi:small subunit ribosomal protein S9